MKTLISIIGPTATGKSAYAIHLAKRLRTEVISADSVQVYRDLSIGSAKVTPAEMQAEWWLVDAVAQRQHRQTRAAAFVSESGSNQLARK